MQIDAQGDADYPGLVFELDMDYKQISRSVFTTMDALGSAGGLSSILLTASYFLNSVFSYNKQDNYLATRLYRDAETGEPLRLENQYSTKSWLQD